MTQLSTNPRTTNRRLYEWGTYAPTGRLRGLLDGSVRATRQDLAELFGLWADGQREYSTIPRLPDFVEWLQSGAEITW